jgi:hypothetical protein
VRKCSRGGRKKGKRVRRDGTRTDHLPSREHEDLVVVEDGPEAMSDGDERDALEL